MKIKLLLLVTVFITMNAFSQELALARLEKKFGFIDKTGNWKIQPQFIEAKSFSDDLAEATLDKEKEKFGYINRQGEWAIEPTFFRTNAFDSGIALARYRDSEWFYINKKGEKVLTNIVSKKLFDFHDGLAIYLQDDKYGFINTDGEVVVKPIYDKVHKFVNGFANVKLGKEWGMIDKEGNYVIKPQYRKISKVNFPNQYLVLKNKDNGVMKDGKFYPIKKGDEIWNFFKNPELTMANKGSKFGFINTKGNWVINPEYKGAGQFVNGLAPVKDGSKWGYINESGKVVIDFQFKEALFFSEEGLAPVKIRGGDWGFVNTKGELVIKDEYEEVFPAIAGPPKGFAAINIQVPMKGLEYMVGTRYTNEKRTPAYLSYEVENQIGFINGLARVMKDGKWGYINTNGELLNNMWFDNVEMFY